MRVAFVTPEYMTEKHFYGGLSNYLYRVCLALKEMGHWPIVIVSSDRDECIHHEGIEIHRVKPRLPIGFSGIGAFIWQRLGQRWLAWIGNCYAFRSAIRKQHARKRIDIIQYTSYQATALFCVKSVPSVVRISSYQPCLRVADGIEMPSLKNRVTEYLERISLLQTGQVFSPSAMLAERVGTETGRDVEVIESPFFFDVVADRMDRLKVELVGKRYLLYFGSIRRLKGVEVIAHIISDLLEEHPDLLFVLAGRNGPHGRISMVDFIRERANVHGDRVIHFNEMAHSELYPIIKGSFAVVLPSLIDNFPNACLEAMAFGKVVIGTNGASFEELIVNGQSGLLCKPGDPVSLRESIESVLRMNCRQRHAIGENARKRIKDLTPDNVIADLVDFYEKVIETAGKTQVGTGANYDNLRTNG